MHIRNIFTGAALAFLMSACTVPAVQKSESLIQDQADRATPALASVARPENPVTYGRVQVRDDVWVGGSSERLRRGDRLPRKYDLDGVTFVSPRALGLQEIGDLITRTVSIPVTYASEIEAKSNAIQAPSSGDNPLPPPPPPVGAPAAFDMNAAINTVNSGMARSLARPGAGGGMKLNYKGSLSGFLSMVGSNFGVTWEYKSGQIRFYRLVTRTFSIAAMPTSISLQSAMKAGSDSQSDSSDSGSLSAGSQQQAEVKMSLALWKEIEATVKGMVGQEGFYAVSQTTSSVTVSAPYDVIERIGEYFDLQNEKFLRQVAVSVEVLSVTLNNSDSFNLDIQGIFNNGRVGAGAGTLSPFPMSGGLPIIATASGKPGMTGFNVGILDPNSSYRGSNALIEALSKIGKVAVVTTSTIQTMSGVPVPLQVSNTRNYVKSLSTTLNAEFSQTSVDTDKVNTGFSLNVLPKVMPDGQVMLQYGINISELVGAENGFDTFKVDTSSVQLPNINQRSFIQQNMLKTGSTLVLAGFEQVRNQISKSGIGAADFPILGGGQSGVGTREILVITITPVVIETALASANQGPNDGF